MTRGEAFIEKGRCKNKQCLAKSTSAWTDLNSKEDILKLHDKCSNPKRNCQTIITFKPHQYMLEGGSIKNKLQKILGIRKLPGINSSNPLLKHQHRLLVWL